MERLELLLSNRTTNSRFKESKGDRPVATTSKTFKTLQFQHKNIKNYNLPIVAHSNLFVLILVISGLSTVVLCEDPLSLELPCKSRQWYNTEVNDCVACTVCGNGEYVKRACHLDRNTICAPLHELRLHIESLHLDKHLDHHQQPLQQHHHSKHQQHNNVVSFEIRF